MDFLFSDERITNNDQPIKIFLSNDQESIVRSDNREEIIFLCGLGYRSSPKIPNHLKSHPDGIFEFNKAIIDATLDHCVSYKINTAFYEALGLKGWDHGKNRHYIPLHTFQNRRC